MERHAYLGHCSRCHADVEAELELAPDVEPGSVIGVFHACGKDRGEIPRATSLILVALHPEPKP